METSLTFLWNQACDILKEELSEVTYTNYITPLTPMSLDHGTFTLLAPNQRVLATLTKQEYYTYIQKALAAVHPQNILPVFTTDYVPPRIPPMSTRPWRGDSYPLNRRYTFDSFVVGEGNKLANAASRLTAEMPGNKYNPLFIYGGTGLGKTHLMHAIGNHVLTHTPEAKVIYVTSERFTNELITAIQTGKNDEFRNKYRNSDVLLVDDIQFIADKERTQDEFFHTFNVLHESGKQIVLSADNPPKGISQLKERLISRFEGGLLADIFPPDYETRVAILAEKIREEQILLEDMGVLSMIANIVKSNIRQLEGTLNRVVAYAALVGKPITMDLAKSALSDFSQKRAVTAQDIQQAVCNYFSLSLADLCGNRRSKELSNPRQIAMFLVRELTELSLPDIGKLFGKHHSTVLHARDKILADSQRDPRIKSVLEDIRIRIQEID